MSIHSPDFGFRPIAKRETFIVRGSMHQAMLVDIAELHRYLEHEGCHRTPFTHCGDTPYSFATIRRQDGSDAAELIRITHD